MYRYLRRAAVFLSMLSVMVSAAMTAPVSAWAVGTQVMWRLYNPNTGEHFYTANTYERGSLAQRGWRIEGAAWIAPTVSSTPVYRLYNPVVRGGDHHYTVNSHERDMPVRAGWRYEGVGWYSDDAHGVALQRVYNPNASTGTHHYTIDTNERDALRRVGWRHEGIAWYDVSDQSALDALTLEAATGCRQRVVSILAGHAGDGYFLGTPYGNRGAGVLYGDTNQWSSRYPNGRVNPSTGQAYLNCAGFVSAVVTDAGGSVSPIASYANPVSGDRSGNDTNALKWNGWLCSAPVIIRDFSSLSQMLASGFLERGDLIYMEPHGSVSISNDVHMGFFWGSTSSEDLFWHSSLRDGAGRVAGSSNGNKISHIVPNNMRLYRVIKVAH